MRDHKRFVFAFGAVLLLLLSGVMAFNFIVDPFQYYRKSELYRPILWGGMQRHQNAGLARHHAEEVIVIGSSVTENFFTKDIEASWGKPARRLSISGSLAHEQYLVTRQALATGRVREVMWGADAGAFMRQHDAVRDDQAPFPWHMYRDKPVPNVEYLLAIGTTRLSIAALRGYGHVDFDTYHSWHAAAEYGPKVVLKGWTRSCDEFTRKYVEGARTRPAAVIATMTESIERNMVSLVRQHPGTVFHIFLPSMATLMYAPADTGFLRSAVPFREVLARAVTGLPNVRLYDFQAVPELANDLGRYKDPLHYDLATSRYIIDAIRDGRHLVRDTAQMTAQNEALIAMVNAYDICRDGTLQASSQ